MAVVFHPGVSYLADSRGNNKSKRRQRVGMGCSPHCRRLSSASTDVTLLAAKLPLAVSQRSDVLLISRFTEVS